MPSATDLATIVVANLESTERFFKNFEVECWNSARDTLIAGPSTATGIWETNKWKQRQTIWFRGLTRGTTYSFRTRTQPTNGGPPSAWSAWVDEVAGDTTAPNPSYAATSSLSPGGVLVSANPSGAPSDLDRYEFFWNLTGSTPAATDLPNAPANTTATIDLVLGDTDTASIWIRGVDTSGNRQAWTALGSVTSSGILTTAPSPIPDGYNLDFELTSDALGTVRSGWITEIGSGGAVAYETSSPIQGARSGKVSGTAGNPTGCRNRLFFQANAGEQFHLQGRARCSTANVIGVIRFSWYNGAGAEISTSEITWSGLTSNTTKAAVLTAPANTVKARVEFFYHAASTGAGDFIVDSIYPRRYLPAQLPVIGGDWGDGGYLDYVDERPSGVSGRIGSGISAVGVMNIFRNGSNRYFLNANGHGFDVTPPVGTTGTAHISGGRAYVTGAGAEFRQADRNGTSPETVYYTDAGYSRMFRDTTGDAALFTGTTFGHFGTPSNALDVFGSVMRASASAASVQANDSTGGGAYAEVHSGIATGTVGLRRSGTRVIEFSSASRAGMFGAPAGSDGISQSGTHLFDSNVRLASPVRNLASHVTYRPTSNPLTASDAGATATVSVAAFTMRVAGNDISVNSGSITGLSFATTYYIYYDDAGFGGGSVTFASTTTRETALNGSGRFFVGSITTPADGGSNTVGNNDGGSGAQLAGLQVISPLDHTTAFTGTASSISSPGNARDGNENSGASVALTGAGLAAKSATLTLRAFQPTMGYGAATLKIRSEVSQFTSSLAGLPTARLRYSLDGGGTWTNIFNITTPATRSNQVDSVALSTSQKPQLVQVEAFVQATGVNDAAEGITLIVYEAWIEFTG